MVKCKKVGIVACSNGRSASFKTKELQLTQAMLQLDMQPVWSKHIYETVSVFSGTAKERADSLMKFYRDPEITEIFDISGGDLANEILPYLDYPVIAKSAKTFWGYSDLTTVINAIYTKTGAPSILYQLRNIISDNSAIQMKNLYSSIMEEKETLFQIRYQFIQKTSMEGIILGGNIRCFLKLAGTEYWPDLNGKILLLEALHGSVPQMTTYLNQLKQIGAFHKISGILLGTFTAMEQEGTIPTIADLVKAYAGPDLPIAYTPDIGHGSDAKAIIIGKYMKFHL